LKNITNSEESQIRQLELSMNDIIDNVLLINDEESDNNKLASPIETTVHFPLLSQKVYNTKSTVEELTKYSID